MNTVKKTRKLKWMNLVQHKPIEKEDVLHQNFIDSYFDIGLYSLYSCKG